MSMYHFSDTEAIEHDVNTVPDSGDFERVEIDGQWYVPEHTSRISYEYDGVPFFHPIHVHELTCGHDVRLFEDVPRYCPYCGAKVVGDGEM